LRALVTGGAGFIGSNLVDRLIADGNEVICIDDCSAPQNERFYWNDSASNHQISILDPLSESLYEGIDVVFHLAARSRIQPTVNNPGSCFDVNVLGTQRALEFSRKSGVKRFIYSASSSYYGKINLPPFKETAPPGCTTPYSLSKWQGEQICDLYRSLYGMSTVSLRYFNVYGDREPTQGQYAPVMGLFRRQVNEGKPVTVVGDGTQRRDFTHVSDVVNANILASRDHTVCGILNIGTGESVSILQIAEAFGSEIEFIPERVGEMRETRADITRARFALGWEPTIFLSRLMENRGGWLL
jgi:UDP-glucose 4-epimerase